MSTAQAADTPAAATQAPTGEVILHNGKVAVSGEEGAYRFAEVVVIAAVTTRIHSGAGMA